MKLHDFCQALNPRRVRIFPAEKGAKIPIEQVDIGTLQHRSEGFTAINPMQRLPALVLDDGAAIAESMAICRYFEALYTAPPLFGQSARKRADRDVESARRVSPLVSGRHRLSAPASVYGAVGRAAGAGLGRGQQAEDSCLPVMPRWRARGGRPIAGEPFTVADIQRSRGGLYESLEARRAAKACRWREAVSARPSAKA